MAQGGGKDGQESELSHFAQLQPTAVPFPNCPLSHSSTARTLRIYRSIHRLTLPELQLPTPKLSDFPCSGNASEVSYFVSNQGFVATVAESLQPSPLSLVAQAS